MVEFRKIIIGGLLSITTSSSFGQLGELIWADPVRLGPEINSEAYEALLVFSRDSSQLFFVREGHVENIGGVDDQDIWSAKHNGHLHWDTPVDFKEFNNKDYNAVVGMSMDGQTVYLYNAYIKKKNVLDRGIAVSHKKGEHWTTPVKVDIKNFHLEGEHFGFFVNMQETFILISCECKGTKGQEDLYVSKKESDGWGEPIHLGDKINTTGFEISPYLSEDTYSLFYSTDGLGGEGDADIFVSFRQDDSWTNWSTPQNLGNKINSSAFDAYFIMSKNDAYFASSRTGNSDIYHVIAYDPPPVIEIVKPVDTTPIVTSIEVEAPKFNEFKLYFSTNSSYLEKEAIKIIDEAIALMKANPNVKIEISSYADIRADEKYNIWLTERRAKRIKDYATLKGIDPNRIECFWLGKKDPVTTCTTCSEEEYRLSRRTVIRVYK